LARQGAVIHKAVAKVLAAGNKTSDLGGNVSTTAMGDLVASAVAV
jgi:isocitrate/isopropylmalate dehydrogenase